MMIWLGHQTRAAKARCCRCWTSGRHTLQNKCLGCFWNAAASRWWRITHPKALFPGKKLCRNRRNNCGRRTAGSSRRSFSKIHCMKPLHLNFGASRRLNPNFCARSLAATWIWWNQTRSCKTSKISLAQYKRKLKRPWKQSWSRSTNGTTTGSSTSAKSSKQIMQPCCRKKNQSRNSGKNYCTACAAHGIICS